MQYSYNNGYPIKFEDLPDRIRMPDGTTKTGKTDFTEEDLSQAGWKIVIDPPNYDVNKTFLTWVELHTGEFGWEVRGILYEDKASEMRRMRDRRLEEVMWRIYRYQRELRLGIRTTDKIEDLDLYMQQLADIPKQESFPWYIEFPREPEPFNLEE